VETRRRQALAHHLDECLRDTEESIADLRRQLEPLESGVLRTAEIRDGKQVDTTDARILWLKSLIAGHERIAAKLRADGAS
jgi:hypothetical protein